MITPPALSRLISSTTNINDTIGELSYEHAQQSVIIARHKRSIVLEITDTVITLQDVINFLQTINHLYRRIVPFNNTRGSFIRIICRHENQRSDILLHMWRTPDGTSLQVFVVFPGLPNPDSALLSFRLWDAQIDALYPPSLSPHQAYHALSTYLVTVQYGNRTLHPNDILIPIISNGRMKLILPCVEIRDSIFRNSNRSTTIRFRQPPQEQHRVTTPHRQHHNQEFVSFSPFRPTTLSRRTRLEQEEEEEEGELEEMSEEHKRLLEEDQRQYNERQFAFTRRQEKEIEEEAAKIRRRKKKKKSIVQEEEEEYQPDEDEEDDEEEELPKYENEWENDD